MTTLRFTIGSSFNRMCYYPENPAAVAVVPKGRRTLRPDEFVELINAGQAVELGVATFVGKPLTWLAVTPSGVPAPGNLLAKAESRLASLLAEYRKGEVEEMRDKYIDELRRDIEEANAIVAFIVNNS
jgi:hypothetical protein